MRGGLAMMLCAAILAAPVATAQGPRLAGFAANLPGSELDDAVWIENLGAATVALDDLTLEDNRGRIGFPAASAIDGGATIVVAGNATAYQEAAGVPPDYALEGLGASRTMRRLRADFSLAQDGDTIRLLRGPETLDAVVYGDGPAPSTGWSLAAVDVSGGSFLRWFPRAPGADRDQATDWSSPRRFHVGQDTWPPATTVVNGDVAAYLAPDHARSMVELALRLAQHHLRLNVYEFRDLELAALLATHAQANPGLRIDVLLDAAPVGETRQEHSDRGHVVERLAAAGATVRFLEHGRYGFDHAKYAVIDDRIALVQSENLVPSGVPEDHASGNRGWGVYVANETLARALARVFDADVHVRPFGAREPTSEDAPEYAAPVRADYARPMRGAPLVSSAPGNATLLVAPLDPWRPDPVVAILEGAQHSIRIAQLNFPPSWGDGQASEPHPYLKAISSAAERGVRVQALLDGHFLEDEEAHENNAATASTIQSLPTGEARLVLGDRPVLHAKGLIVDDRWVLVGSMNWNDHAMLQNREVDVLLDHPETARFFSKAFDEDWSDAEPAKDEGLDAPSLLATLIILASLVRAAGRRNRT